MLTLQYLPANAAYVFVFGSDLLRMGDGPMFFARRKDAVEAAKRCGLAVARNGKVSA